MLNPPASLWWSTLSEPVTPRVALRAHLDVDVAIIGGGFTGLWTARELLRRDPSLQVAILEQSVCGFGASGRNGGWASALFPVGDQAVIDRFGVSAWMSQRRLLEDSVVAFGAAIADDGIDAHFQKGGTLSFARSEAQRHRLKQFVEQSVQRGVPLEDFRWLSKAEANEHGVVSDALGATYSPHCARINPARLVRGLADTCALLGARIFEQTKVTRVRGATATRRAQVLTTEGTMTADFVVQATEGFTPTLPGKRRSVAPLYSLMIATEPLSSSFWDEVGFRGYETFSDGRHLIIYGQRTNDDRIAFGGRGAPYHFGSTVEERFDNNLRVFSLLEKTLRELFPSLPASVTHAWGGPLAMPRNQFPFVSVNFESGLASAGGYTGDGVVLSYVAANALADLLSHPEKDTDFTTLPFVQQPIRPWEFEPFRWLGINSVTALAARADRDEARSVKPGQSARALGRWILK